jgi:two-component system cell cycle response regulator
MKVLIAEDDALSRRMLEANLVSWGYDVVATENGAQALALLRAEAAPSLAILDITMPEMDGLEVCRRVRRTSSHKPLYIIMLTGYRGKQGVVTGIEAGANDYLHKPYNLDELRARLGVGVRMVELQNALAERVRELADLSLTDDLTGLRNRRGFISLAEQQLKLARTRRTENQLLLVYADIDGLKLINDKFGHEEGSRAIEKTSDILRKSFRESDIIGRMGGDEFTILAVDADPNGGEIIISRLETTLYAYNQRREHPYPLSLSVGWVRMDPRGVGTITELIAEADRLMYVQKRSKKPELALV